MKRLSNGVEGGGGGGVSTNSLPSSVNVSSSNNVNVGSSSNSNNSSTGGVGSSGSYSGFVISGDWWKRDFCYATLTLITFPLPFVFQNIHSKKMVAYSVLHEHIVEYQEIPLPNILYVVGMEVLKVVLASLLYPALGVCYSGGSGGQSGGGGGQGGQQVGGSSNNSSSVMIEGGGGGNGGSSCGGGGNGSSSNNNGGRVSSKLPISRRDRESSNTRNGGAYSKSLEVWKSLWNFVACCGVCHILMILFGAPLIESFSLTLEFSVILVALTVFPLYLNMKASSILIEIAYISVWNTQLNAIFLAKWRLLLTIFGCMVGAIFIPLDWDKPWQKWPITCLVSAMISFYCINAILFVYIFCSNYCKSLKNMVFNRNSNKIKYF